ncbi:DUF742 domain-containing protein [Streptomyces sp. NPDC046977]|uniref:DUF742 domain-containing protein n=1 Tax=Streptomyces sp. NPDC046977 TaxID=3154703 RepID=UPI0033F3EEB7
MDPEEDVFFVRPYLPKDEPLSRLDLPRLAADQERPLRPFLLTGGRVVSALGAHNLESQIVSTREGLMACHALGFEHRDIVLLCAVPQSIAEVSAKLSLHLNVVRVLVGDLQQGGYLTVNALDHDASSSEDTLRRIIRALEAIR